MKIRIENKTGFSGDTKVYDAASGQEMFVDQMISIEISKIKPSGPITANILLAFDEAELDLVAGGMGVAQEPK